MLTTNEIYITDCLKGVSEIDSETVQCCVTSPPYYQQRDYGIEGQYGLESTPEAYIERLVTLFKQVKRVLKPDGVLWLNLSDSYWGSGKAGNPKDYQQYHTQFGKALADAARFGRPTTGRHATLKPKDMIGIPWAVAFALRADGWYLRQDCIWAKFNCMPESTKDRCTRNHEYVFMLSKSERYYYDADAIKEPVTASTARRMLSAVGARHKYSAGLPGAPKMQTIFKPRPNTAQTNKFAPDQKANKRTVWHLTPSKLREEHYAAFPIELPMTCIKAGSRPGDNILDPFMGAGTTALAAAMLDRKFVGFELNPRFAAIAKRRLRQKLGLFDPAQHGHQ